MLSCTHNYALIIDKHNNTACLLAVAEDMYSYYYIFYLSGCITRRSGVIPSQYI